jgi:hypothetical protein
LIYASTFLLTTGCDWYNFKTATGYGVPVTWQDVAKAYYATTGNKDKVKLSTLVEWFSRKQKFHMWKG